MVILDQSEYKNENITNLMISILQKEDKNTNKWIVVKHNKKKQKPIIQQNKNIYNEIDNEIDNEMDSEIDNGINNKMDIKIDNEIDNRIQEEYIIKHRNKFYAAQYTSPDPSKLPIPSFYKSKLTSISPQQMK